MSYRFIGKSLSRTEDARLIQGLGRYTGDLVPPGHCRLYVLRSPYASARIRGFELETSTLLTDLLTLDASVGYLDSEYTSVLPGVQVGRGVRLNRVVVDRGCEIPDGMVIGEDPAGDAERFYRTDNGITLVTREMLAKLAAH